MSHSFGESYRVGSALGAHAITVFCSWDHKVTQKRASRLQCDNIRTQLKVRHQGRGHPTLSPATPSQPLSSLRLGRG
ncbi:Transmembrane channel-like protein 6 [Myotis davidii]|uniref:Transmembrane channel-like protein 6 n=1 Tax=Myotis davidii TaxID=225400 RepID=L5MIB6_MYODS|nr:Transmembrane channel-like protein 6 [Myotis davidii]